MMLPFRKKNPDDGESGDSDPAEAARKKKAAAAPAKRKAKPPKKPGFLGDAIPTDSYVHNPGQEAARHFRLARRIHRQGIVLIGLILAYFILLPILQPAHVYYARMINNPAGTERRMNSLNSPILTQDAILSWATTSVTEVMTFNFANYNERISLVSNRFLPEAWIKFVEALTKQQIVSKFKSFQLVMTAAPSGTPVIASEGANEETGEYEWKVQIPVIVKYVTNNNKSTIARNRVDMTIVRVSTLENPYGIAIKEWWTK